MRWPVMYVLPLLFGCPTEPTDDKTGDTGTSVPDSPTPTDTGTPITDTAPLGPPETLTFAIDGDAANTAIIIRQVDLDAGTIGAMWGSGLAAGATASVTVDAPSASDLAPLDPQDPTIVGAFFLVGLLADDGDAQQDAGEVFVGVSPGLLVYLAADDALSIPLKVAGLHLGWNAFAIDPVTEAPIVYDTDAIPVVAPAPTLDLSLSGTWAGKDPARLALAPATQLYGTGFTEVLYDAPLAADWTVALSGAPPVSHQAAGDPNVPDGTAIEVPTSYTDTDASESLSVADTLLDPMCTADDRVVWAVWFPHAEDLFFTYLLQARSGWMAVADPTVAFAVLPETEVTGLHVGACGI